MATKIKARKAVKPAKSNAQSPPSLSGIWALEPRRMEKLRGLAAAFKTQATPFAQMDDPMMDMDEAELDVQKSNGIAHIPVVGVLTKYPTWCDCYFGFTPAISIQAALINALNDQMVNAIVLHIDCPGGMVAGTTELAEAITAADAKKPVYALISDTCASGGYWLASQCRSITANTTASIGSIGVYQVWTDDSKFWEDMGVTFKVVSSGGIKGMGADGKIPQELIDDAQREIDSIYAKFIGAVASGRGMAEEQVKLLADGRCHMADESKSLGLIDSVASRDAALEAIFLEVSNMTEESFQTHATEHPESVAKFVEQGKKAGANDSRLQEIERAKALKAACGERHELALDSFIAGRDPSEVSITVKALDDADAKHKAEADAVAKIQAEKDAAAAAKDAEIQALKEKLAFASEGKGGLAAKPKPVEGEVVDDSDPKSAAKSEAKAVWAKMTAAQKSEWLDEDTFVRAELRSVRA